MTLPPDRSHVATEQRNDESRALDAMSTGEIVRPLEARKATPRHTIRPPSVTIKDGMDR